jgi:hypothetical protein
MQVLATALGSQVRLFEGILTLFNLVPIIKPLLIGTKVSEG